MNDDELQSYLNVEKEDKEHEKSKMPIIHTGVPAKPRKCPHCPKEFDGLRALYNHLITEHPGKPLGVGY